MTLTQEIMCFIPLHHSFGFPDIIQEGGSSDPYDPPLAGSAPGLIFYKDSRKSCDSYLVDL